MGNLCSKLPLPASSAFATAFASPAFASPAFAIAFASPDVNNRKQDTQADNLKCKSGNVYNTFRKVASMAARSFCNCLCNTSSRNARFIAKAQTKQTNAKLFSLNDLPVGE